MIDTLLILVRIFFGGKLNKSQQKMCVIIYKNSHTAMGKITGMFILTFLVLFWRGLADECFLCFPGGAGVCGGDGQSV